MDIQNGTDKFGQFVEIKMNHQPSGGKTWLAKITGPDPKYKLKREFLSAGDINRSSSGKTGTNYYFLREDGYYEYDEAWKQRGFFRIENGEFSHCSKEEVIQAMKVIPV